MTDYSSYDKEIGKLQPGKGHVIHESPPHKPSVDVVFSENCDLQAFAKGGHVIYESPMPKQTYKTLTQYAAVDDINTATQGVYFDDKAEKRIAKLENDIDFLRGVITELYNKCPKTSRGKKKKQDTDIECENCGGLLW